MMRKFLKYSFIGVVFLTIVGTGLWLTYYRTVILPAALLHKPVQHPVRCSFMPDEPKKSAKNRNAEIRAEPSAQPLLMTAKPVNVLKNTAFNDKLQNWYYWQKGKERQNDIMCENDTDGSRIRIANPNKELIGVQQQVMVVSGQVYRLSGKVRSPDGNNASAMFGGRIGFWLPPQEEKELVWMTEYNQWLYKEMYFTNRVTGRATVYAHMGYGNVAGTGEFTDIKLELLVPQKTAALDTYPEAGEKGDREGTNLILRISNGTTSRYTSVVKALKSVKNNDTVLIMSGTYYEKNAGSAWLLSGKRNVHIKGIGNPTIIVPAKDKFYQIALQMPMNSDMLFEGITLYTPVYIDNNALVYNAVFTGGRNILVSNCVFKAELFGTNTTFKNFVAINNADNITVMASRIITLDMTGKNYPSHCATHNSKDTILFTNVTFSATALHQFCVGPGHFRNCRAEREYVVNGFSIPADTIR